MKILTFVALLVALACPPADDEPPVSVPPTAIPLTLDFDLVPVPVLDDDGLKIYGPRFTDTSKEFAVVADLLATMQQREQNLTAYRDLYLPVRDELFDAHAGAWIVIAGGEVLPYDDHGAITPAATLEEALAATALRHLVVLHRFVFQVGDDGDLRHYPTVSGHDEIVGRQFLRLLRPHALVAGDGVWLSPTPEGRHPDMRRIGRSGDAGVFLDVALESVDGAHSRVVEGHVATGYSGGLILGAAVARELELARWEIPGMITRASAQPLRRAWIRARLPEAHVDTLVRVALRD